LPLCAYGDARMRAEYTQVENAFIREFMPFAAGDAVKVYLYGLMQCQHGVGESTLIAFARAVSLSERDVEDAFAYWQDCGLVRVTTSPAYSVLYQSAQHALPLNTSLYTQSALHAQLQSLFLPSPVTPSELSRMLEWTDVFRISPEAVVMLINYGRAKMPNVEGAMVSRQIRYIDKIARQWADEGVRTPEQADEWLRDQQRHQSGVNALLGRLGLRRSPTAAERKLYAKWLAQGFDDKAILLAADRTASIRQPSFESVDNILGELGSRGAKSADEVMRENSEALCKEALTALGLRQPTPTAAQLDVYRGLLADGHDHEHILLAAEICRENDRRSLREVTLCLKRWRENDLRDGKAMRAHEAERARKIALLAQAFACMGLNRRVSEADLDQYAQWAEWGQGDELILFAAESAHGAVSPYRMMKKLLEQWHAAGIDGVSVARRQMQPRESNQAKQNPALAYPQRETQALEENVEWM
jgi:DNA replication protein DnaD